MAGEIERGPWKHPQKGGSRELGNPLSCSGTEYLTPEVLDIPRYSSTETSPMYRSNTRTGVPAGYLAMQ